MQTRNILLLYIIKLSKWFMLYMPISLLYYLENDLGNQAYLTLHAVYSGVIALCEVPSGYIADVWGRKPALVLGSMFGVLGFFVYSSTEGVIYFLLAEILLGIGQSLISGADSAMLYDTLLERKQEKKYLKHEGSITALGNISEVSAALFVSFVIFTSYRSYFYLQTVISVVGLVAGLFLAEPQKHKRRIGGSMKDIWKIVVYIFMENHRLRNLIIYTSVIGFASLSMAWLTQPLLVSINTKEENFGFIWAALNVLVAIGSLSALRLSKKMNFNAILFFIGVPLGFSYFFAGSRIGGYIFIPLVVFYFVRGTAHPILKDYINRIITSDIRATVLSVRSLIIRILFLVMGPVLGYFSERISLQFAFILCGTTIIIPLSIYTVILISHNKTTSG